MASLKVYGVADKGNIGAVTSDSPSTHLTL